MPEYRELFRKADRNQAYADALLAKSVQSRAPRQRGRVVPKMHWGEGLAQLGEALLARHTSKKAGETREEAEAAKNKAIAEALSGMGLPSDNPYASAQNAIDAGVNPGVVGEYMGRSRPQEPDLTDDQREYQYAVQQGYQGTLQDWIVDQRKAGAPSTTIRNEGSIPPGYSVERDNSGNPVKLIPIPGSPAAREMAATEQKDADRAESANRKSDIVIDEIDRSFGLLGPESPSFPETGFFGKILARVAPESDAASLAQRFGTIRSNIGFDRLQEMRENSPTGGALGNVTVQEIERLESVLGSLEQSQRKEDVEYNLARLNNLYLDTVHGEGNGPKRIPVPELSYRQEGDSKKPASEKPSGPPAVGQVVDGYQFMGGDPSNPNSWKRVR